jgi:hypothetical protein
MGDLIFRGAATKKVSINNSRNAPNKPGLFTCAAGFANKYSIAGGLNTLGIGNNGGIGGFLTSALGGNAFSGLASDVTQGNNRCKLFLSKECVRSAPPLAICMFLQIGANCSKARRTRFHGGNTGSNPVGDANQFNSLALSQGVSRHAGPQVQTSGLKAGAISQARVWQ